MHMVIEDFCLGEFFVDFFMKKKLSFFDRTHILKDKI